MRQTVARGTRYLLAMFNNQQGSIGSRLGDSLQWKNLRQTFPDLTASITERWQESCGNLPVNFVSQARGKSYLTLPCGTSEEPITWTREALLI